MKCIAAVLFLALVSVAFAASIESAKAVLPSEPEAQNAVAVARNKRGYLLSSYTAPVAYSAYSAYSSPLASYNYPYAYSAYSSYPYYASAYNSPYYLV